MHSTPTLAVLRKKAATYKISSTIEDYKCTCICIPPVPVSVSKMKTNQRNNNNNNNKRKRSIIVFPKHSLVRKNYAFLKKLYNAAKLKNYHRLKDLVQSARQSEIETISEIAANLLNASYPKLSRPFLRRLEPFKQSLRTLASKKSTSGAKKRTILQRGGIFPLASLLIPVITSLTSSAISSLI